MKIGRAIKYLIGAFAILVVAAVVVLAVVDFNDLFQFGSAVQVLGQSAQVGHIQTFVYGRLAHVAIDHHHPLSHHRHLLYHRRHRTFVPVNRPDSAR